ncbi:N-6 DNA methylase [Streptomyces sp. NRRL S-475]|uniref:N-6 DNA methylase n=1 Tax=Streptomyces sp. NRRL S-475 TaxID=1463910 RepID=UPI0004CAE79C|nr:N-6 DNA methylase [Streptomyces sp. NRRL S-475]
MTLYGIPPAGLRRAMAPESGRDHAHAIADAAHAWWTSNRGGTGDRAIAVGTLAALALCAPSRPDGPDYGPLLLPLDDEQLVDTLRAGWNSFWTYDPDLTEAARPLHDWLSHPTDSDVRDLADYARILVRAGLLEYCSDTARAESDDVLGLLITRMRSYSERQSTGEFFTPAAAANNVGDILLSTDRRPGDLLLEPAAGTGTMTRAAAATMRYFGADPAEYRWWLNDLDPLNAACCAVNAQLWRLGQHVTVSCGDALKHPRLLEQAVQGRAERASAEQKARPVLYPTTTRPPFWPWQFVPPS